MVNTDSLLKQHQAELLKSSLDSLYSLRDQRVPYTLEDEKLFADAFAALQQLKTHLEAQGLPRWIDVWGQPRHWEHPSK